MRWLTALAVASVLVGCRARSSRPGSDESQGNAANGRCEVIRAPGENADCYAVRCAEDYVRRGGYTVEPPSVTPLDDALGDSLAQRHGMLYGSAIIHERSTTGHVVGFRYRDSSDNVGRAVTMNLGFGAMKLDPLNLVWPPDSHLPECLPDAGKP
jgi:hypothetical protein